MSSSNAADRERRAIVFGWLPFLLGRSRLKLAGVPVRELKRGKSPHRFLVIHGDEGTAQDVLTSWMRSHEGIAYVVTGKTRNVEIEGLKIDPNRLWSRAGADMSLRAQNPGASEGQMMLTLDYLDRHREAALRRLTPPAGSRLFAMHNNRDYSVQDELAASDRTSIKQPDLPRNFFLCTGPEDFEKLRESPYNVVLQTKADPDDGSLSRLAARRGFRYINLECAIGDYDGQWQRVQWLEEHLS